MYTLYTSAKGHSYVSRHTPTPEGASVSFTREEVREALDRLLFRKERANGVGRHLMSALHFNLNRDGSILTSGMVRHVLTGTRSGFTIRPSFTFKDRYEIELFGDVEGLLSRLNGKTQCAKAREESARLKEELRKERPRRKARNKESLRALPTIGKMHWHFRNHDLAYDDAVRLVAKAARLPLGWIRRKLGESLDERGVASVRLEANFVVRIDLGYRYRGLMNLFEHIELRTTDDNGNAIYRRLRSLLKTHFECQPRARTYRIRLYA